VAVLNVPNYLPTGRTEYFRGGVGFRFVIDRPEASTLGPCQPTATRPGTVRAVCSEQSTLRLFGMALKRLTRERTGYVSGKGAGESGNQRPTPDTLRFDHGGIEHYRVQYPHRTPLYFTGSQTYILIALCTVVFVRM